MTRKSPTILIVDDERHIVEVLARRLQQAGFNVATASCVSEAIASAGESPPALIVTDLQMPGGSGLDLAQSVRANPTLRDVPIILLSARGFLADVRRLHSLRITTVMEKPFSSRKVCEEVGRILGTDTEPGIGGMWLNHPDSEAA